VYIGQRVGWLGWLITGTGTNLLICNYNTKKNCEIASTANLTASLPTYPQSSNQSSRLKPSSFLPTLGWLACKNSSLWLDGLIGYFASQLASHQA
jgi:hypothetical protein